MDSRSQFRTKLAKSYARRPAWWRRSRWFVLLLATWPRILSSSLEAAVGDVDPSFTGAVQSTGGDVRDLAIQSDGKIILVGDFPLYNATSRNFIARANPDGSLDPTFNPGSGADKVIQTVALQADGKILIGGEFTTFDGVSRPGIARLNKNGSLDASFSLITGFEPIVYVIAVQPDGKIFIGGDLSISTGFESFQGLVRLNQNGSLDTSFKGRTVDVHSLALQANGKILLAGGFTTYNGVSRNGIARANQDGSIDPTFDPGTGADDLVIDIALQPDGKIVLGGNFDTYRGVSRQGIARANSNGSLDTSFDPGSGTIQVRAITLLAGGDMLIASGSYDGVEVHEVARINANGSLDPSFSSGLETDLDLFLSPTVFALAVQGDGKFVIGGEFALYNGASRSGILRVSSDGALDATFMGGTGIGGTVNAIANGSGGKIVIGGAFTLAGGANRRNIARLNGDGSSDPSFDPGAGTAGFPSAAINALAVQADGKIVIGGVFDRYDGQVRSRIARVNADGSLDSSFDPGSGVSGGFLPAVFVIAIQSDAKIVIAGEFAQYNGVARNRIARLNANGSLDTSFDPGSGVSGPVKALALQADGKILIGGDFGQYNGVTRARIARLNANGSLDTTFDPAGTAGIGSVNALLVQPDGKIVLGGRFVEYHGTNRAGIARANPAGTLDNSFDPGSGVGTSNSVDALALQGDGKILLGGSFTQYNGVNSNRIARIKPNGSLDTAFDVGAGVNGGDSPAVRALVLQPDGNILVGGVFSQVDGRPLSSLARLLGEALVPARLLNISTRLNVLTGDKALIGGFIITGTEPKKVIIRGIGPSLSVSGALQDPTLELFDKDGSIATNDNWKQTQQAAIKATSIPPKKDAEAAIVRTLAPGSYTVIVRGKNESVGVGLVEVYDLAQSAASVLANISSRGFIDTGDNALIGGFIVGPAASNTRVVVRALGPSLQNQVSGTLDDPALKLIDANGATVRENDNWKSGQKAELEALNIQPSRDAEAALIAAIPAGGYTAVVQGKNNTKGVAVVEVYNVP